MGRPHKCPIDKALKIGLIFVVKPVVAVGAILVGLVAAVALSVLPPATVLVRTEGKPLVFWWASKMREFFSRF